nr:MAG TPA: hypothetical protein [Caudoviricetes sp.]
MERLLNLDKVFSTDKHYPFVIETLLTIFKYTTDIKGSNTKIHCIDKQKFDDYIDTHYPANKYDLEDRWFDENETAIYVVTDEKQNKVKEVFISHDDLDTIYEIPSSFWGLFDEYQDILLLTNRIRYSVKKMYDPSLIEKLDESNKIKFDLVELIYKKLSSKFETLLEIEFKVDEPGIMQVIPVFRFIEIPIENGVSDKPVRTSSIVEFFDKYYQMEDTIRSINKLMEERNGR